MKEKILELRNKKYTYKEIVNELKCSKSLVSYYCSKDIKNNNNKYDKEICLNKALEYKTIGDFSKNSSGEYNQGSNSNSFNIFIKLELKDILDSSIKSYIFDSFRNSLYLFIIEYILI